MKIKPASLAALALLALPCTVMAADNAKDTQPVLGTFEIPAQPEKDKTTPAAAPAKPQDTQSCPASGEKAMGPGESGMGRPGNRDGRGGPHGPQNFRGGPGGRGGPKGFHGGPGGGPGRRGPGGPQGFRGGPGGPDGFRGGRGGPGGPQGFHRGPGHGPGGPDDLGDGAPHDGPPPQ